MHGGGRDNRSERVVGKLGNAGGEVAGLDSGGWCRCKGA